MIFNRIVCIWPILISIYLSFLISGSLGWHCIPGAPRSPKHRDHPWQRQSRSADNEQKHQLWKWWAHSWDDATFMFVHFNCQSTSDSVCLCTRASCDWVCAHKYVYQSACANIVPCMSSEQYLHLQYLWEKQSLDLISSWPTYSIMAKR